MVKIVDLKELCFIMQMESSFIEELYQWKKYPDYRSDAVCCDVDEG